MASSHRLSHMLFGSPLKQLDPGDTKSIYPVRLPCSVDLVSGASAETRTMPQPNKPGLICSLVFGTDGGGAITLTVTGGYNQVGDTIMVFNDAGDHVTLRSIKEGTSYYWRVADSDGAVLNSMTPGTGISTGTGTICEYHVQKVGGVFKTDILIDLTGLNGCGAAGDIIGKDGGTVNCHLGRILAAVNGTLLAGRITCFETPAGGNVDVDLWSADESTGAQDAALAGTLTGEVQHLNHGAWAAGELDYLDTLPATGQYLYLGAGANTDADFSAGRFLIELWGT